MLRVLNWVAYVVAFALVAAPPAGTAGPLQTAVWHPVDDLGVKRVADAGASAVHITLTWRDVAPVTRTPDFRPSDHQDPGYRWEPFDERIRRAVNQDLAPIVDIYRAPDWAQGQGPGPPGTVLPSPAELGAFARAAATRYGGGFGGLPRVRHWQAWAEQNLYFHLNPQSRNGRAFSPVWYRSMLNAFADAVRAVHPDNVVVTGGLAPFTTHTGHKRLWGHGPLHFMRVMLCMGKNLKPTCKARSKFDVWSHHPYTSGGPTHHANFPDDVSLGDLPEMKRLLDAAVRAGHVVSREPVRFWVTEFGWDTGPPDPKGLPPRLHARWVSEALYRMWSSGVSLVTWLQLRDDPLPGSLYQSGLYFRGSTIEQDRPKPALHAFRFPFVALPEQGDVRIWGRTPTSRPGPVVVERSFNGGWMRATSLRANRFGIFTARLRAPRGLAYRARFGGEVALTFRAVRTRDRPMFAFGTLPN